tara:strand:- start:246 stop:437 length:192 start_codon:yes stop_codon:yes gene_type:complete
MTATLHKKLFIKNRSFVRDQNMTSFGGNKKYSNPYAEAIYTRFQGIENRFFTNTRPVHASGVP